MIHFQVITIINKERSRLFFYVLWKLLLAYLQWQWVTGRNTRTVIPFSMNGSLILPVFFVGGIGIVEIKMQKVLTSKGKLFDQIILCNFT